MLGVRLVWERIICKSGVGQEVRLSFIKRCRVWGGKFCSLGEFFKAR